MLLHGLFLGHPASELDGRHQRHDMVDEGWEADGDETHHHRAGGADGRTRDVLALHVAPGVLRDDLRAAGNLEHVVETHVEEALEHIVHVRHVDELAEERRRRKRDQVLGTVQILQAVADGPLGLVGTDTDAFPAVDALEGVDHGMSVTDADSFRRATPQTVGAALAFIQIQ